MLTTCQLVSSQDAGTTTRWVNGSTPIGPAFAGRLATSRPRLSGASSGGRSEMNPDRSAAVVAASTPSRRSSSSSSVIRPSTQCFRRCSATMSRSRSEARRAPSATVSVSTVGAKRFGPPPGFPRVRRGWRRAASELAVCGVMGRSGIGVVASAGGRPRRFSRERLPGCAGDLRGRRRRRSRPLLQVRSVVLDCAPRRPRDGDAVGSRRGEAAWSRRDRRRDRGARHHRGGGGARVAPGGPTSVAGGAPTRSGGAGRVLAAVPRQRSHRRVGRVGLGRPLVPPGRGGRASEARLRGGGTSAGVPNGAAFDRRRGLGRAGHRYLRGLHRSVAGHAGPDGSDRDGPARRHEVVPAPTGGGARRDPLSGRVVLRGGCLQGAAVRPVLPRLRRCAGERRVLSLL